MSAAILAGAPGASLSLRGVAKTFGVKSVLKKLDLTIPPGEFIAIVGRSGCGKTTLLRLIAGLETVDAGEMSWTNPAKRPTRVMFQEPRLLPWLDVLGNVRLGFGAARHAPENLTLAREALARVGLADKAGEWPALLSGGQRQRVALARALVSGPGFLALDEPLGALDALTRVEMQGLLEDLWRRDGFSAALVTHDVAEAVRLADRILLLEAGRIALDIAVDLPRPRERGDPQVAALEDHILRRLMRDAEVLT